MVSELSLSSEEKSAEEDNEKFKKLLAEQPQNHLSLINDFSASRDGK